MSHPLQSYDEPTDVANAIPMFSKNGTALSEDERERIAQKRGQCLRCGIKTKDVKSVFKRSTITSEQVYKGTCIRCNPDKVPQEIYQAWESKFRPNTNKVSPVVKFRAAARATAFLMHTPPSRDTCGTQDAGQAQPMLPITARQGDCSAAAAAPSRHVSLQPPSLRAPMDSTRSMSALHNSAPATFERSPLQFDQISGSFRHIDSSPSSSADGNISGFRAAKTLQPSELRPVDGGTSSAVSERRFNGHDGGLSTNSIPTMTMSERQTPSRTAAQQQTLEEADRMLKSAPLSESCPPPSRKLPPRTQSLRDGFQHKSNLLSSTRASSSWHAYDHESARSVVASDFTAGDCSEDIGQVMQSIKENRKHPEVLKQKLHRLRNLAECEDGTLPVIVDILNEYRNDSQVLTAAVGALWSVTAETDERKVEAAECGSIDCVLDSLRNSQTQEDAEFCEWATGAVACLSRGHGNRAMIGRSNGVETVLDTLRLHRASPGVFEWSCRALHALVHQYVEESDDSEAIRRNMISIDENDGISVIVGAMKVHHVESIAQRWAILLLLRLMDREDRAAVNRLLSQVNEADGSIACVKVLKARSTTPRVLSLSAELMANLVVEAQAAKNTVALQCVVDCIPSILRVMKENDGDEIVQESCCRLFSTLAKSEKGRQQIKEKKALVHIVYSMMKHSSNISLQEAGCWTLWTISSFPDCFGISYTKDAMTALNASTKEFPDEPLLLSGACGFIANVNSVTETNMSHVSVQIPIRALKARDPTDMADEQACRALRSICIRAPARIGAVFEGGGVDSLVKRLRSQSLKASASACKALAAMANTSDEIRRSTIDAGALDAAVSLLGNLRSTSCLDEVLELVSILLAWEKKRQSVKLPNDSVSVIIEKVESICDTPELIAISCDALLNLLLATGTGSKSLDLDGLIGLMTKVLGAHNSTVAVKQRACNVLWALVTKQKIKNAEDLSSMFRSVSAVMNTYKGEDRAFESDLQSAAAGALSCISARIHDAAFPINSEDVDCVIAVAYMTMEYDRERTELLEKLLNVILNVSLMNESLVVQCGGIVLVIDAMVDHENDESILELGCLVLGLLSSTEDLQVNLCIAETDGIDMIISSLASFPSNAKIQVSAWKAVSHLSIDNESREMIVSQGGLMLLVNAMNSYRENANVLEGALSALLNLSSDAHEQILADTNALQATIEIMRLFPDVALIQENGLGVLQNLSMRSSEAKREIAKLGGIKILIEAINAFMGVPKVLERAFTTMWSLAILDSNQKVIAKARGAELVLNGMLVQIDSASVQRQACGCLCALSTDSQNNAIIRDADGVDAIIYTIWAHFDSEPVLCDACKALSSVAVDMNTHEVIIAQEGEINAVVSAMRCFPKSAKLQQNACVALRNLLLSPESVEAVRFLSDEIRAVVAAAATHFPEECSECASQVLEKLL